MRKVYSIFVMGIALVLVSVAFTSVPVSAETYTGTFNLYKGYRFYQAFWWPSAGTRAVTLSVRIDYDDWGFVDIYFLDQSNFNVYESGSGTIYPIFMDDYDIDGGTIHTGDFNINPVAYANYYLVIDNTDNWGGIANDYTYGAWELTDSWVLHQLYGYVYKSGTTVGIPGATVFLTGSPGSYSTTTNQQGYYSLNAPEGIYSATISASGYLTTSTEVSISVDRRQDFYLIRFSPPSEPLNLLAIAGDNQATLSWTAPSDSGGQAITNYKIYRGTTSGGETLLVTIGNVLSYVDTTAMNDVRYYYQVSAVNFVSEGPKSGEYTLVIPEFESLIFLLLFMAATILVVIVYRRKQSK